MGEQQPPENAYSDDHAAAPDDAALYRRINPDWVNWDELDTHGRPTVTSQAFQDCTAETVARLRIPAPGMSIGIALVLEALGFGPERMLEAVDGRYGLVALEAAAIRRLEQGIQGWPTETEPWHGIVFQRTGTRRSKATRAAMADMATWVIVPKRGQPSDAEEPGGT